MTWPSAKNTVLALLVGGAAAALAHAPRLPAPYPATAVPEMLALAAGATAACISLGATERDRRWWMAAATSALAFVLTLGLALAVPEATKRSQIDLWVPWIATASAAVWAGGWALERWAQRRLPAVTGVLVALAFASGGMSIAERAPKASQGRQVRAWNVYHYYLGSKYFGELGYTELYAATLAADDLVAPELPERARSLQHVRYTRDMHTYQRVPRAQAVQSLDPSIDDELLRSLHADLRGLLPFSDDDTWKKVISDLGYNPAPAWPVIGKPLAWALDTRGTDRWILTSLDVPLFVVSLLAVWWAWGPRMAAGMVIFVCTVGFNRSRLLGGFLAYDWLASLLVGMALWRKGWSATGGAVLSWGAMTRVFPGFLVFPGLVLIAHRLWTQRSVQRPWVRTPVVRFVASFTAACAVWFALSHTTGRGLDTWPEWVEAIRVHSTLHPYDGRARLGLPRLAAHEPTDDDLWGAHRRTTDLDQAKALHRRARPWQLLGVLLVVLATVRRTPYERALWMLALVWVAVTTSRYYGSSWALLLALGLPDKGDAGPEQSPAGVVAAAGILMVPAVWCFGDSNEEIYFQVNYWMGAVLLAVATIWLVGDGRDGLARRATDASPVGPPSP
jgi:hypothetical protein